MNMLKSVGAWKHVYACFILLAICDSPSCQVTNENIFVREADKRASVSYLEFPCASAVLCCQQCLSEESCELASYNKNGHLCELSGALHNGVPVTMVTASGWNVYKNVSTNTIQCESGMYTYGTSCYWVEVNNSEKWNQAQIKCEENGGRLVHIESQEEMLYLINVLTTNYDGDSSFWIGASSNGRGGMMREFTWTDGTLLADTFTYWGPLQPDTIGENCVEIKTNSDHTWNDKMCDSQNDYICEK